MSRQMIRDEHLTNGRASRDPLPSTRSGLATFRSRTVKSMGAQQERRHGLDGIRAEYRRGAQP